MFLTPRILPKLEWLNIFECMNVRRKALKFQRFLSYKHLGGDSPLLYKTVGGLLNDAAAKYGDRTAYVSFYQNQRVTFREVKEKADEVASGLFEMGISPGDRVGMWLPNSVEWYIVSFALAKAGAISVYLNPYYYAMELKHCLNAVGVKLLVTTDSFKTLNYINILKEFIPELSSSEPGKLKSQSVPSLKTLVCISDKTYPGMFPYDHIAKSCTNRSRKKLKEVEEKMNPDDASNIQFTSGTTGTPKGAVLSHCNIVNNSFFIGRRQHFHLKEHVMCFMGPLFHALGCVVGLLPCVHEGLTFVIPDVTFNASKCVEAILKEKCTILLGTPTMYVDVLNEMKLKGLKAKTPEIAVCGGAYASTSLFSDMLENLGIQRVSSVYGLTEAGPVVFMSKPTDSRELMLETVGHHMEHMEVKVVDENGDVVPWNTPGELWVRGYNIMKGYWNDEKKTKETITEEHWLKSGDQFVLGEDGYGRVVGRIKDMIIRGGENIFPADIEEFLSTHPKILDVQVVGLPDERLGEVVCACIRVRENLKLTKEEIKEFCQGRIANFKVPQFVFFVDDFPKTSSGKIQKFKLREMAMEHFKLKPNKK